MRTQFVHHREQASFLLENVNQLRMFREIIVVYHHKYKDHINALYQYADYFNFQAGGTHIHQYILKG